MGVLIVMALIALFAVVTLVKTVKVIPQARAGIVERFGKYRTTLSAGVVSIVRPTDSGRP